MATRSEDIPARTSFLARVGAGIYFFDRHGHLRRALEDALRIELANGATITLPVKLIPSLNRARPKDIRAVEIVGRGSGLHWESLDLDLSVPALVSSVFAGTAWLAELGRVGGRRTSAAKTAAARRNGRRGGRPRLRLKAIP